jgi:DNA-directed RNA polymerase specialized sigma24 family protein
MNLNSQKAKPAEARSKARQQTALDLRTANHSYSVIGEKMGISKSQAHRLVMDALADLDATVKEAAERLRVLEVIRCDALAAKLWPDSG